MIATDVRELFGGEDEVRVRSHQGGKSSSRSWVPALPAPYYELMLSLTDLEANNPYNRLITAIEIVDSMSEESHEIDY